MDELEELLGSTFQTVRLYTPRIRPDGVIVQML